MAARAQPGATIVLHARSANDFDLDPNAPPDPRGEDPGHGSIHSLAGPVHIEGAEPGDVLKIRILDIAPGPWAWTDISSIGFVSDQIEGPLSVRWKLNREFATSEELPGIRIPNHSFPGVVTVLPGPSQLAVMLQREAELLEQGGAVFAPYAPNAVPAAVCGEDGSHAGQCLRTVPPREHGGNLDIRYLQSGVAIYLPCFVPGCGLAVGDLHYAQGDGEVAGTALEMDGTVTLTTELIKNGPGLSRGPHYEGPSSLLDIPSRRFYATTGFPLKEKGDVPPDMRYLGSAKVSGLENLSKDISLAARNALLAMIDHISQEYGYTREQAYIIASVAVDLRIGQLVDAPNVGVTAILPLDIFEGR
jgi:formamidase